MAEPENGIEFIKRLREENGKDQQSFSNYARFLGMKARKKGIPITAQFELTPLCNFGCKMCYVHLNPEQMNNRSLLPVETWKKLASEAVEAGVIQITLSGGECLTYPGFDELYLHLQSLGCQVAILTNGYLLDEKKIAFLRKHRPLYIQITFYGWNDDVYERVTGQRAFGVVAENARKAVEAGLPVNLNVTPSIYLGEDVFETIRVCRDISRVFKVNSSIMAPREDTGRSLQHDDPETEMYVRIYKLLNELKGKETQEFSGEELPSVGGPYHECSECGLPCGGGRSTFSVTWKGMMQPCTSLHMIQADILEIGFKGAWNIVNQYANSWPRVPECKECPYAEVCVNCPAVMLQYAEPGKQPIGLCDRTKNFVRHGIVHIKECN